MISVNYSKTSNLPKYNGPLRAHAFAPKAIDTGTNRSIRTNHYLSKLTEQNQKIYTMEKSLSREFQLFLAGRLPFAYLKGQVFSLVNLLTEVQTNCDLKPFIKVRLSVLLRRMTKEQSFTELHQLEKAINAIQTDGNAMFSGCIKQENNYAGNIATRTASTSKLKIDIQISASESIFDSNLNHSSEASSNIIDHFNGDLYNQISDAESVDEEASIFNIDLDNNTSNTEEIDADLSIFTDEATAISNNNQCDTLTDLDEIKQELKKLYLLLESNSEEEIDKKTVEQITKLSANLHVCEEIINETYQLNFK